uniref:C2H2-type domain-containing protein n=1 Tax=Anabas testudineus TaxID=64144 RepID=A0A3Q1KFY5_ANATE
MGDMKTPDFDDLLAAFDIPDIDAKEAIQSSPEEEGGDVGTNANERGSGSPSCFSCSPASDCDPPAVSVIVKNTVRSESFEEEEKYVMDKTVNPSSGGLVPQVQVKLGDLTTELGPTLTTDCAGEPQIANGLEGSVSKDHSATNSEPLSQHSPFRSSLNYEDERDKGAEVGSIQHSNDVIHNLKPLLYSQSQTSVDPSSSSSPSPQAVSPHLPPPSPEKEEACIFSNPSSSPLEPNGSMMAAMKDVTHLNEDDSEPDLGSPLVIQESPESLMSASRKFKHRATPQSELQPTPPSSPSSTVPQPQTPKDTLPSVTVSAPVKEEKYPEHVIDERDSPESPPPSETEDLMESEPNKEDISSDPQELSEKMAGDEECVKEDNSGASTSFEDTVSTSPAETVSSPLRPLKVKIKMPTGSITRTVSGVAPKRSARATSKAAEGSKPLPQSHNTRSKIELSQQCQSPVVVTPLDVCAVQEKTAVDTKPKVSPTAVSITKTATLPSVSKVNPGGINLRSLGQKTLNSGTNLPAPSPLLHPQSSSRPASIVNNTGAIISKNQTNLVEAFNKILNNKNLLPSYKPDLSLPLPAEWGIALPAQGYRCLECGDSFALEQSLARHYDRRSLRIEVTCNHCAKRLAFFNKCSLLLHAREHKEKGLIMQCSHLVMKPVPVEQMIGQQELMPVASLILQVCSLHLSCHLKFNNNKCPECQTQFSSKEEMAEHFQEIRPAHTTPCTECSPPMLLPNTCSAAAHSRIHQGCTPHVCPECGATVKQSLFQTHLDRTCLHFARRIGYRYDTCCLVVFGGLNSVKSHIQQAHCDMFHKCPSCPMAFKSTPSIQSHITAQHPTVTEGQTILIYKCVMCDTVFTHKPLLYAHFDTHLINQKVNVFKCPECTKLFSQRNSLLDHFKVGICLLKQEMLSSDGEGWMEEHKEVTVKTERLKTPSGWNCAPCHARYTDREDYITHMAKQHGKILKKFPCNKCESSFTTTSSLRRHIRDKHKVMNRGFRCQFCTESKKSFSSRAMLEKHVQLRHSMDTVSQDTLIADSSSEQDGSFGARRKRKGAVKMEQDEESTDGMSPVKKLRSSSARAPYFLPESGFRCAPCGFTTENQSLFLEHISQHRRGGTEGSGLQCLQCGACFTSTFSLSRHRFITHKVRDAFADNQQALSVHLAPSPTQVKEEEDTLACKVCSKHFEKATDLNTHFRTHGMAFISARNAGKTT